MLRIGSFGTVPAKAAPEPQRGGRGATSSLVFTSPTALRCDRLCDRFIFIVTIVDRYYS